MSDEMGWLLYLAGMALTAAVPVAREAYRVAVEDGCWNGDNVFPHVLLGFVWPVALPAFMGMAVFHRLGRRARRRLQEKRRMAKLLREEGIEP